MRLIRPEALALLVLAAPIVWAWLRRPPLPTRTVSSLLLLRMLPGVARQKRRLRDPVGLALLLLALLGATLGLAVETGPPPTPWIALVDDGRGMAAETDDGRSRYARARAAFTDALAARPGAPVTLVTTAPLQVQVEEEPDPSRAAAALPDTAGGQDGADPAALLAGLCAGEAPPELLVFSDDAPPEVACPTTAFELGEVDNAGLTRVVARAADGLGLVEVHVQASGTDRPLVARVEGGEAVPVDDGLARLGAPAGGALTVSFEGADGLAEDDAVALTLPPAGVVRVGLVTDAPRGYLATALATHPRVRLSRAGPDAAGLPDAVDLLVVETPPAGSLPAAGHVAVFGVDPAPWGIGSAGTRRLPQPAALSNDAALLRFVDLEGVHIESSRTLTAPGGARPLVGADGALLVVESGDTVAFGFRPVDSDLPLRVDFVHLVTNLVEWADPAPPLAVAAAPRAAAEAVGAEADRVPPPTPLRARFDWRLGAVLALLFLAAESLRTLARSRA